MPEEVTPAEVLPEPRNVREAIEQRRAAGDPGFVEVTEAEAHAYPDGTPSGDTDEFTDVFGTPAAPKAPEPEPVVAPVADVDPYAEYGGKTVVEDAMVLAQGLRTEQGVRAIIAQGLSALGYQPDAVAEFLRNQAAGVPSAPAPASTEAPAAADPFAGIALDDEDVVTGAQVKQLLTAAVQQITSQVGEQFAVSQQEALKPLQQQVQEDRQRAAREVVDNTLIELLDIKLNTPNEVQLSQIQDVQAFASKYLDPNTWDPQQISNALRRGHADMVARDEARFQAYVATKRAAASAAPANIGGASAPGGEDVKEPRNVKEAIAMRKALGLV